MEPLIIIGNGGHSQVVQSTIKQTKDFQLLEIWDDTFREEKVIAGIRCRKLPKKSVTVDTSVRYFIAIGDNQVRNKIKKQLKFSVNDYATIIHPKVIIDG